MAEGKFVVSYQLCSSPLTSRCFDCDQPTPYKSLKQLIVVSVPLTSLEERRVNCVITIGLERFSVQVSFAFGSIKAKC